MNQHPDYTDTVVAKPASIVVYLCTMLGEIPNRAAALRQCYITLKLGSRLSITEIFPDPHYQSRATVQQLTAALQAPQGTVSRHLSVMRAKGVVVSRREGTNVYYRLGSPRISAAYDEMHQFAVEYIAAQTKLLTE